jgi:hypothetical protein
MTAFLAYILSHFSWCTLYTVGRAGITVQYAERTTERREYEGVCRGRDLRPQASGSGLKFLLSNFEDAKTKQLSPLKYQRHADRSARQSVKLPRKCGHHLRCSQNLVKGRYTGVAFFERLTRKFRLFFNLDFIS